MLSCLTKILWWFVWCLINIVVLFICFSAIVINTMTQNDNGKERLICLGGYSPSSWEAFTGPQARPRRLELAYCLYLTQAAFLHNPEPLALGGTTHTGWALPHKSFINKIAHRFSGRPIYLRHFLNWCSCSQVTVVGQADKLPAE